MFSRSTAPAHCARGRDSMGSHWRCCPISSSAWAGVSTGQALLLFLAAVAAAGVRVVLGLIEANLLVEAVGYGLQLVDGGVVLLHFHFLHVGLLLRRELVAGVGDRSLVLELDAGDVGVDVLVVLSDCLFAVQHLFHGGVVAVRKLGRRWRISAIGVNRSGQCGERRDGEKSFHTVIPVCRAGADALMAALPRHVHEKSNGYLSGAAALSATQPDFAGRYRKQSREWSFTTPTACR